MWCDQGELIYKLLDVYNLPKDFLKSDFTERIIIMAQISIFNLICLKWCENVSFFINICQQMDQVTLFYKIILQTGIDLVCQRSVYK